MQGLSIPADTAPKAPLLGISFRRENREHDGHVGLAWRDKNGGISILHQRWHFAFTLDTAPDKLDALVQLPLPRANIAAIIRYAVFFHQCIGNRLPYAFRFPNAVFDEKTGKLLLRRGEGLTCTTMVIALLEGAGVVLVKREDWPMRVDDEAVHVALLERMRKSYIDREGTLTPDAQEHIAYLNFQKKATRFRPAEVAAAASIKPLPAGFVAAEVASRVFLSKYDEHFFPGPAVKPEAQPDDGGAVPEVSTAAGGPLPSQPQKLGEPNAG